MLMNTPVEEEDRSRRLLTVDEMAGRFLERHVSVNVRGLAKLPLVVQARAAA